MAFMSERKRLIDCRVKVTGCCWCWGDEVESLLPYYSCSTEEGELCSEDLECEGNDVPGAGSRICAEANVVVGLRN